MCNHLAVLATSRIAVQVLQSGFFACLAFLCLVSSTIWRRSAFAPPPVSDPVRNLDGQDGSTANKAPRLSIPQGMGQPPMQHPMQLPGMPPSWPAAFPMQPPMVPPGNPVLGDLQQQMQQHIMQDGLYTSAGPAPCGSQFQNALLLAAFAQMQQPAQGPQPFPGPGMPTGMPSVAPPGPQQSVMTAPPGAGMPVQGMTAQHNDSAAPTAAPQMAASQQQQQQQPPAPAGNDNIARQAPAMPQPWSHDQSLASFLASSVSMGQMPGQAPCAPYMSSQAASGGHPAWSVQMQRSTQLPMQH